jgi:hypothetical protein
MVDLLVVSTADQKAGEKESHWVARRAARLTVWKAWRTAARMVVCWAEKTVERRDDLLVAPTAARRAGLTGFCWVASMAAWWVAPKVVLWVALMVGHWAALTGLKKAALWVVMLAVLRVDLTA